MNTWNGLPYPYWKKVYDSIRAALNKLIMREKGVNNAPAEPIDTQGMAYNKAAMEALLQEPAVEQPVITVVDIPRANDIYFDAEDGVIYGSDGEGDRRDQGHPGNNDGEQGNNRRNGSAGEVEIQEGEEGDENGDGSGDGEEDDEEEDGDDDDDSEEEEEDEA